MMILVAALALQPPFVAPPPGYVSPDAPMSAPIATDPATGVSLIKRTCWDHLRDPVRLQAEAERLGFNFFWFGSRRERRVGTGAGTLNYHDAGLLNRRGWDRQCDIFMRIEPRDHETLIAALAAALELPAAELSPAAADPTWMPPNRETHWTVRNRDGTTLRVELTSYQTRRDGNVHFYVTLHPRAAAARPRRAG